MKITTSFTKEKNTCSVTDRKYKSQQYEKLLNPSKHHQNPTGIITTNTINRTHSLTECMIHKTKARLINVLRNNILHHATIVLFFKHMSFSERCLSLVTSSVLQFRNISEIKTMHNRLN